MIFQCTYKADNSIVLTEELARTLLLAERNRIAFKIKDDCIEFGPYLGVLSTSRKERSCWREGGIVFTGVFSNGRTKFAVLFFSFL